MKNDWPNTLGRPKDASYVVLISRLQSLCGLGDAARDVAPRDAGKPLRKQVCNELAPVIA